MVEGSGGATSDSIFVLFHAEWHHLQKVREREKCDMAGAKRAQVPGFKLYIVTISHTYENREYNL